MTQFIVEIDANPEDAAEAQAEARAGGDGSFPPLPLGKYQLYIEKVLGVVDFGGDGPNGKKKVLNLQVRVVDESPTGAKRVFFLRVPLFTRYAPNDKHPKGAPARLYFDFFEKVVGIPAEQVARGQVGDMEAVGGKRFTGTLKPTPPYGDKSPLGSNEVTFVAEAGDIADTPTNPLVVPWLDNNGKLTGQWANGAGAAPGAPAQQATPPAYGQPATPPAYGQQPAAAPAYAGAPAYGQQPPAPAYATAPPQQAPVQQAPAGAPAWQPSAADVQYAATQSGAGY